MKTFVIHTPKPTDGSGNRSFEDTLKKCAGEEFAISRSVYSELQIGMPLIILDKRQRKQAEATISAIEFKAVASNGIRRYDVHFRNSRSVPYNGDQIRLNRCGVRLI